MVTETHLELFNETAQVGARITCPTNLRPAPGQYLAASSSAIDEPLPVALFPSGLEGDELIIAPPLPDHWTTGTPLALRGPLGRGFRLPQTARRVALAALDISPARLLPLAFHALEQHASVTLYSRSIWPNLPLEVEILPLDLLHEAPVWADYLAVDVPARSLPDLRSAFHLGLYGRLACPAEVLIYTPMPCTGLGECGVCAIPTRSGWQLACGDGPVFDWSRLEG